MKTLPSPSLMGLPSNQTPSISEVLNRLSSGFQVGTRLMLKQTSALSPTGICVQLILEYEKFPGNEVINILKS